MKILWLEPPRFSVGMRSLANGYAKRAGLDAFAISYVYLSHDCLIKKTKTKWIANDEKAPEFHRRVAKANPDFIVINDRASLYYITGKYMSLALTRGGIYQYNCNGRTIPALVIDDLKHTRYIKHAGWVLINDMRKLQRWITGELRPEAKFTHTVCHTIADVRVLLAAAKESVLIGIDIETTAIWISCIGYTCISRTGKVHTYVIPIINPQKPKGTHWELETEEMQVWDLVREIHNTDAIKVMQNGSYDSTYFLVYKCPLHNYLADTLHGWHSIWIEAPKRLDFIASIAMDTYQYWKDEGKEDAKEDVKGGKIPKSAVGIENYWRYNALDCHNTAHSWLWLLEILAQDKMRWARDNYAVEFRQQLGPALAMSMRGIRCNSRLHTYYLLSLQNSSDAARKELLIAADNPEYNANSPVQYREMLYEIFQLKPYKRKGKVTDEKILQMIKEQNIWADWFIEKTWQVKKPANNASKYRKDKVILNGRFMYKMSAAATDTGRYGSKGHDLWVGTNIQNVPYVMRPMCEADDGYVLFDIDYAQSDAYFTAFDLQEESFIETMLSDKDTHCIHAAFFFKIAYEKLAAAHANKEDWCSHNQTGVRSITKRIVYGANYEMQGETLLITMTRAPVIAAAIQLGYEDAGTWNDNQLAALCNAFLGKYFQMYPGLKPGLQNAVMDALENSNTYTCAFGKTRMFFNKLSSKKAQREFAAFIGQGGTAGNINKALDNIYYGFATADGIYRQLEAEGVMLLFQVHDSIIGQVPEDKLHLIGEVQVAMANECTLHGKTFTVPTAADCGLGWGKRLMPWTPELTLQDIKTYDAEWWQKFEKTKCLNQ